MASFHRRQPQRHRPARTEAGLALWEVPFRFLDNLVKGSDIMPFFAVFAAIGLWFAWRQHGLAGRVVVAWFVLLYLAYACAPQKLYPFRPVLRDAGRFLSSLAIPYSVLIVFGLLGTLQWLAAAPRTRRFAEFVRRHPVWFSLAGVAVLAVSSFAGDRRFFTLGYVPELRAYMRALPADAVIFTHRQAYILAHLVDAPTAERLHWRASDKWIVDADPQSTADEAAATDFWYVRKLAMMKFSKDISTEDPKKKLTKQPPLAPWFDTPELHWRLAAVMARSDTPDIILYKRRHRVRSAAAHAHTRVSGIERPAPAPALRLETGRGRPGFSQGCAAVRLDRAPHSPRQVDPPGNGGLERGTRGVHRRCDLPHRRSGSARVLDESLTSSATAARNSPACPCRPMRELPDPRALREGHGVGESDQLPTLCGLTTAAAPRGEQAEAAEHQHHAARFGHNVKDEVIRAVGEAERAGEGPPSGPLRLAPSVPAMAVDVSNSR
jgi:hypothetical protein